MKKVLVIGAGFLQDFVIRKAKSLGYETLAVDADPNAVGFSHADKYKVINIVDEKACLEYAREEKIDGVLTAATDYGVLTAAYIAKEMNLPGLNYDVAKLIKNKYKVRKCLYDNKADDTLPTCEVTVNTDIRALSETINYPVIVKPCDGSGSRGTYRVNDAGAFEKACGLAMDSSITHCATVEPFIFGKEYGAESFVLNGKVYVLGIMRKWMTQPPYYAELGHAVPTDLPKDVEERTGQCVKKAIEALGINFGSVNMDIIITPDAQIHIVDIGARMGGNMIGPCVIPYSKGIDYTAMMIHGAVGDNVDFSIHENSAVATRLLAFDAGVVKMLPDFELIEKEYGVEIYHHLEIGQTVREYHTNLDGCGYIVARADNIEDAICKAETVLNLIKNIIFAMD